jgi:plasmid stabilization system protein ParE
VKITFHGDALGEYVAATAWYERDYPGRGERFAAAVETVLERVASEPDAFPTRLDVHAAVVSRFPYVVFFDRPDAETIRVLPMAHGKRRPGYWRGRR